MIPVVPDRMNRIACRPPWRRLPIGAGMKGFEQRALPAAAIDA